MDGLTAFGLFAVTAMLVCYALEEQSTWLILAFAAACGLGSLWVPSGRLAVRIGRSDLGARGPSSLALCRADALELRQIA
jgi:hypothetical protein